MALDLLYAPIRKHYEGKSDQWLLLEDITVYVGKLPVTIPEGYVSDFASVPFFVPDWIIPRHGLSAMPSVGHDYLCEYAVVPRQTADAMFRLWLIQAGVPRWQVNLMYNYVRLFGWVRYGEGKKRTT